MVTLDPYATAHAGREQRLQAPALAPGQPPRVEPAALLEAVQVPELGPVVAVERDGEGAAGAVAGGLAARLRQLGGEVGVAARRRQVQAEQRLLAVVRLGDGSQHARRDLGGPATGRRVGQHGTQPALGGAPRGDQADDAAADDQHVTADVGGRRPRRHRPLRRGPPRVGGAGPGRGTERVLVVRGRGGPAVGGRVVFGRRVHGRPAPPFAGMTRIRFVRSGAASPPLSPVRPGSREWCAPATLIRPPVAPKRSGPGIRGQATDPAPGARARRVTAGDLVSEISPHGAAARDTPRPTVIA